jgi:hypothetical protein
LFEDCGTMDSFWLNYDKSRPLRIGDKVAHTPYGSELVN